MKDVADVAIIGAGPAGCAAAIELSRAGAQVLLLEKARFPRDKVCGEFLSPEVAGLLNQLGCGHLLKSAARMDSARVVTRARRCLEFNFPAPAYGLSRRVLDQGLARQAAKLGAVFEEKTEIAEMNQGELVSRDGRRFQARTVLLATGRNSLLNPARKGRLFGFKAHFQGEWPARLDLHFFSGGYLGIAPIENGRINACALVEKNLVKRAESITRQLLGPRPHQDGKFLYTGPLHPGWSIRRNWSAGDAAAFLDPFTGDGIALAMRSGRLAAQSMLRLLEGDNGEEAAAEYARDLKQLCRRPMAVSRLLRWGLTQPVIETLGSRLMTASGGLRRAVFSLTRGPLS